MERGQTIGIGYLLQHIAAMLMRQSDQVLQERLGIGMSQLRIMKLLAETPDMTQRSLADHLGQTEASISRQVKLLQERGLLTVRTNPKSHREHIAAPTPKGIKLTDAALDALADYHQPVFETLGDKQREQLRIALQELHTRICAPGKPFVCDRAPTET